MAKCASITLLLLILAGCSEEPTPKPRPCGDEIPQLSGEWAGIVGEWISSRTTGGYADGTRYELVLSVDGYSIEGTRTDGRGFVDLVVYAGAGRHDIRDGYLRLPLHEDGVLRRFGNKLHYRSGFGQIIFVRKHGDVVDEAAPGHAASIGLLWQDIVDFYRFEGIPGWSRSAFPFESAFFASVMTFACSYWLLFSSFSDSERRFTLSRLTTYGSHMLATTIWIIVAGFGLRLGVLLLDSLGRDAASTVSREYGPGLSRQPIFALGLMICLVIYGLAYLATIVLPCLIAPCLVQLHMNTEACFRGIDAKAVGHCRWSAILMLLLLSALVAYNLVSGNVFWPRLAEKAIGAVLPSPSRSYLAGVVSMKVAFAAYVLYWWTVIGARRLTTFAGTMLCSALVAFLLAVALFVSVYWP